MSTTEDTLEPNDNGFPGISSITDDAGVGVGAGVGVAGTVVGGIGVGAAVGVGVGTLVNLAVTSRDWSIKTEQLPLPEQSPENPAKKKPGDG